MRGMATLCRRSDHHVVELLRQFRSQNELPRALDPAKRAMDVLHALRAQQEAQTRASPVQSPAAKHAGTSRFFSESRFKKQNWSEHNRREAVGERLSERRSSPPDVLRMRRNALQRSGERSVNGGVAPSLSKAPSRPRPRTIKNFSYSERKRKKMPGPC